MSKKCPAGLKRQAFEILRRELYCNATRDFDETDKYYTVELWNSEYTDQFMYIECVNKDEAEILYRAFNNLTEDDIKVKKMHEPRLRYKGEYIHQRKVIKSVIELMNLGEFGIAKTLLQELLERSISKNGL